MPLVHLRAVGGPSLIPVDLYRVNFAFRGEQRSLLKNLAYSPSVGDHLALEQLDLIVTGIKPAAGEAPATILAVVNETDGTA